MKTASHIVVIVTLLNLGASICSAQTGTKDTSASISGRVTIAGKGAADISVTASIVTGYDRRGAWYVRAIDLPTARGAQSDVAGPDRIAASGQGRAAGAVPKKFWPGTLTIKSGESVNGVSILVGQDAAGLRGTLSTTPDGSAITPGLRVHLVPAERDETGNVLRYFEATVEDNGSFAFRNIAPGRYFIIPRLEPRVTTERVSRPVAFDPAARATLRRDAETLNNIVELKSCQRVVDLELKRQ